MKLSTKARDTLPKSDFGMPGRKAYPMPDKAHAANAKARASQEENKGKLSSSAKAKIDAKADRILGGKAGTAPMPKAPEPKAPKATPNLGIPNLGKAKVLDGSYAPEDKGHMLPGQPGHYRYK
ncbi:MAG: hypothetical protein ACREFW_06835 [Rhizomicrobium sp.]